MGLAEQHCLRHASPVNSPALYCRTRQSTLSHASRRRPAAIGLTKCVGKMREVESSHPSVRRIPLPPSAGSAQEEPTSRMRAHGSTNALAQWLLPLLAIVAVALVARWLSWPGLATEDTVWSTREAMFGRYTTYHPLLNGLLLRALAIPFESYAVYSTLQVALCAVLFFRSLRLVAPGPLPRWSTWVSIGLWAFALHTFLYLGLLWKDIPIAYCLCFIAALAFALRTSPAVRVGRVDAALLGVSVFLCVGLRHGMAINLVLVPLLLGWRRFRTDSRLWLPFALALAGFLGLVALSQSSLVRNDEAHFLKLKISSLSQPFLGIVSNKNGYTSDDYGYDKALAMRVFGAAYASDYAPDYFSNSIVPDSEGELRWAYKAIVLRTTRLCLLNLGPCLSGRFQMMLGTLQPSTRRGAITFYELGSHDDCSATGIGVLSCDLVARFSKSERPESAARALSWLVPRYVDSKGAVTNLVTWNLIPALLLIVAILLWLSPKHPLWLVAGYFAVQAALPFATTMANDFRYYYFLFPFFVVFLPAFLRQVVSKRRSANPAKRAIEPTRDVGTTSG